MSIESAEDLKALRRVGAVVARALREVTSLVEPGVSTSDLDRVAARIFRAEGARSAPQLEYGFPGTILISVNDEVVHGIPGARRIRPGDIVKIDVTAELDGYVADAARSVCVPPITTLHRRLASTARSAFSKSLSRARAGCLVSGIGAAVETSVKEAGLSVIPTLTGHGTGRKIHEHPNILNFYHPGQRDLLTDGLVITIEPLITSGSGQVFEAVDGWTVKTADGAPSAHHENTIVVTHGDPIVLTQ